MWRLFFPHLMITPKKLSQIASCSRGCSICRDNLPQEINLHLESKQEFYLKVKDFFSRYQLVWNQEVTFLYYGDFFSHFQQVRDGIENLFIYEIIPHSSNIWVWIRAESAMSEEAIKYLTSWNRSWDFHLKISLDLSKNIHINTESLIHMSKNLLRIKNVYFPKNMYFLLQLNNIEFMSYDQTQRYTLYKLIKKISETFNFLGIACSDFPIKWDFKKQYFPEFFDFDFHKMCLYQNQKIISSSLEKNFLKEDDIYIEHVDIFEDAISIHNPYCKKLKSNYFWNMDEDIIQINKKLRDFSQKMTKFTQGQQFENICAVCTQSFDNFKNT